MDNCVLETKKENYRFYSETKNMNISELLNFMFVVNNLDLYNVGFSSHGSSHFPSILWARPKDLDNDQIEFNQIVGHTHSDDVRIVNINTNIKHIYIDCLGNKKWYILNIK